MKILLPIALCLPGMAMGDTLLSCAELEALVVQAAGDGDVSINGVAPVECTRSLALGGGRSVDCAWAFAYRSEAAMIAFEQMASDIVVCAMPLGADDPDVSHPDSYDLRQFTMGDAVVSLSLKDKGALSETYVFLRAQVPS